MLQDVFESEEFAAAPVLTPQQESHYLQAYLPLVRKVVRQLAPQCNCIIDRQDMEQTALMGLLNAIRRYGLRTKVLRAMPCTVFAARSWMSCALSTGDRASCDRNIIR